MPEGTVTIGICAPSSPFDEEKFKRSVEFLNASGFETVFSDAVFDEHGYLAGSDRDRARDLNELFSDPEVDIIMCARGGYGSSRIIDLLDLEMIKRSDKAFIGASDSCSILYYLENNTTLDIFFGPFVTEVNEDLDQGSLDLFLSIVRDGVVQHRATGLNALRKGRATGRVTGGCLSIMEASLKTPYEINTYDKLILIEDINEPLYRVDRMLTHLKHAGKFDGIKGVIAGDFANSNFDEEELEHLLRDIFKEYHIPVVSGFPAGHDEKKTMIPFNKEVTLDADERIVEY